MRKVPVSSFLYFFEFVFKDGQQAAGENPVDFRFREFVPVFGGISNVRDENLEIGFQPFSRPLYRLDGITIVTVTTVLTPFDCSL